MNALDIAETRRRDRRDELAVARERHFLMLFCKAVYTRIEMYGRKFLAGWRHALTDLRMVRWRDG